MDYRLEHAPEEYLAARGHMRSRPETVRGGTAKREEIGVRSFLEARSAVCPLSAPVVEFNKLLKRGDGVGQSLLAFPSERRRIASLHRTIDASISAACGTATDETPSDGS